MSAELFIETQRLHRRLRNWTLCELQLEAILTDFTWSMRFLCIPNWPTTAHNLDQNWAYVRAGLGGS